MPKNAAPPEDISIDEETMNGKTDGKTEKSHIFMPSDAAFIRLEGIRIRLVIKRKDKNVSIFFFMNFAVFIISMLLQFII